MGTRKLAIVLALVTAVVLIAMATLSIVTGVTQEAHEWYATPLVFAKRLAEHPDALRALFALDIAFIALYTAFFAALARYLTKLGRPYAMLALAFMLGTTVLDIVEDHHITTMLDQVLRGTLPSDAQIMLEQVLSSTKFTLSYVSLVLFGLAIPRDLKIGVALFLFLTAGTLVSAVANNATGESMRATNAMVRWLGFLLGFGLIYFWLRDAPDLEEDAGDAKPRSKKRAS